MQKTHDSVGNYYITPLWVPDGMKASCKACGCRFSLFKRAASLPFVRIDLLR